MPLICLEDGAIVSLSDDCFAVAEQSDVALSTTKTHSSSDKYGQTTSTKFGKRLFGDIQASKTLNPPDSSETNEDNSSNIEYDIMMTFQKQTTYICIPYQLFRAAMKERAGETTIGRDYFSAAVLCDRVFPGVSKLLIQISTTIVDRIRPLVPWLHGRLVVEVVRRRSFPARGPHVCVVISQSEDRSQGSDEKEASLSSVVCPHMYVFCLVFCRKSHDSADTR